MTYCFKYFGPIYLSYRQPLISFIWDLLYSVPQFILIADKPPQTIQTDSINIEVVSPEIVQLLGTVGENQNILIEQQEIIINNLEKSNDLLQEITKKA